MPTARRHPCGRLPKVLPPEKLKRLPQRLSRKTGMTGTASRFASMTSSPRKKGPVSPLRESCASGKIATTSPRSIAAQHRVDGGPLGAGARGGHRDQADPPRQVPEPRPVDVGRVDQGLAPSRAGGRQQEAVDPRHVVDRQQRRARARQVLQPPDPQGVSRPEQQPEDRPDQPGQGRDGRDGQERPPPSGQRPSFGQVIGGLRFRVGTGQGARQGQAGQGHGRREQEDGAVTAAEGRDAPSRRGRRRPRRRWRRP